jgi:hypothetical protein
MERFDTWKIELALERLAAAIEQQNKLIEVLAQNQATYFKMVTNQEKEKKEDSE